MGVKCLHTRIAEMMKSLVSLDIRGGSSNPNFSHESNNCMNGLGLGGGPLEAILHKNGKIEAF